MGTRGGRLALTALAVLLGFLVVVQIRAQGGGSDLENRTAQELTLVVANLNTRNDQLRAEVALLQQEVAGHEAAQARGGSSAGQIRADLERLRAWLGVSGVSGPGVRITLRGPIPGTAIGDLLNELRNAGAEALSVGGVRVVPGTVVAGEPGALSVENTLLDPVLVIAAVGSPATLTGTLTRAGGIVAQLEATYPDISVEVTPVDRLVLPPTERALTPQSARPKL
ncbi:MAG: hypothetical protein H6Q36_1648 [Chloroflexi bacterium]|nr:hypothetical protein [Chloroflexota bacterium]